MALSGEVHDGVGPAKQIVRDGGVEDRALDEADPRVAERAGHVLSATRVGEGVEQHDFVVAQVQGALEEDLGEA